MHCLHHIGGSVRSRIGPFCEILIVGAVFGGRKRVEGGQLNRRVIRMPGGAVAEEPWFKLLRGATVDVTVDY